MSTRAWCGCLGLQALEAGLTVARAEHGGVSVGGGKGGPGDSALGTLQSPDSGSGPQAFFPTAPCCHLNADAVVK